MHNRKKIFNIRPKKIKFPLFIPPIMFQKITHTNRLSIFVTRVNVTVSHQDIPERHYNVTFFIEIHLQGSVYDFLKYDEKADFL